MNLLLFKGALRSLDYFSDRLYQAALETEGVSAYVADVRESESEINKELEQFLGDGSGIAVLFNQVGLVQEDGRIRLRGNIDIPIYDIIVDHPRYFADTLQNPPEHFHAVAIDRGHEEFIRRFFPMVGDVFFLPHGGSSEGAPLLWNERLDEVIYTGSIHPIGDSIPIIPELQKGSERLFEYSAASMRNDTEKTAEDCIEEFLLKEEGICDEKVLLKTIQRCARLIEGWTQFFFRKEAMQALDQAGIPVMIYGGGWEEIAASCKNIHIGGILTPKECIEKFNRFKISLNFLPWFKDGMHERITNSMLSGALVVTEGSKYLRERYTEGREMIFFDLKNPEQMAADIKWLLSNPETASIIAENGKRLAKQQDTWGCRLCEILRHHSENVYETSVF